MSDLNAYLGEFDSRAYIFSDNKPITTSKKNRQVKNNSPPLPKLETAHSIKTDYTTSMNSILNVMSQAVSSKYTENKMHVQPSQ